MAGHERLHGELENRGELRESQVGGIGPADESQVEERARALAVINGRSQADVTDADREQARRELGDEDVQVTSEEAEGDFVVPRNPADVKTTMGHAAPTKKPDDEAMNPEEEVKEGVREAEHERMLRGTQEESP